MVAPRIHFCVVPSSFYFTRGQHILGVLAYFWHFLCTKALHNFKTKSLGIILTTWAIFVPISAFVLFLVSEVACGEECAILAIFGLFLRFC